MLRKVGLSASVSRRLPWSAKAAARELHGTWGPSRAAHPMGQSHPVVRGAGITSLPYPGHRALGRRPAQSRRQRTPSPSTLYCSQNNGSSKEHNCYNHSGKYLFKTFQSHSGASRLLWAPWPCQGLNTKASERSQRGDCPESPHLPNSISAFLNLAALTSLPFVKEVGQGARQAPSGKAGPVGAALR